MGGKRKRESEERLNKDSSQASASAKLPIKSLQQSRMINVQQFAEARVRELEELVRALQGHTGNRRIFQTVPRHLRRRAASFNIRRLPVRLRKQAEIERDNDKRNNSAPKGTESRRKRRRMMSRANDFAYRAHVHKWLETHIWHAKRMKMLDYWGYKLAEHPNDRSAKASIRSMRDSAVAHDASYMTVLELKGSRERLASVLAHVVDRTTPMPTAKRFLSGARHGTTMIYWPNSAFQRLVARSTFLWRPTVNEASELQGWFWVHPAASLECLRALLIAIDLNDYTEEQVTVTMFDRELLTFNLVGPRSHAILQNIFEVVPDCATAETWSNLALLRTPSSLPADVVLALTVHDPRLSFPRKMARRVESATPTNEQALQSLLINWPVDGQFAQSSIWDADVRKLVREKKIPEAQLNKRRHEQNFPGRPLVPTSADAKLPILLMRRRCMEVPRTGAGSSSSSSLPAKVRDLGSGWDIIVPAGWGNDIWKALVFSGARVGGQREMRALHLEMGVPSFPHDFPTSLAGQQYLRALAKEKERVFWNRPPAKRPSYSKMALASSPFMLDVKILVHPPQLPWVVPDKRPVVPPKLPPPRRVPLVQLQHVPSSTVDQQDEGDEDLFMAGGDRPWVAHLPFSASLRPNTLILVAVFMVDKGVPREGAQVYLRHEAAAPGHPHKRPRTREEVPLPLPVEPSNKTAGLLTVSDVVGLVTSARFSFVRGHGFGIAVCSAERLGLGVDERSVTNATVAGKPTPIWVRNTNSLCSRPGKALPINIL